MSDLIRRKDATQKTFARFRGKVFDWSKAATCIHLFKTHAQNMGHKLPSVPRFRSAVGAKKALTEMGHESVMSLLDSMFPRIAPAEMHMGDVVLVEGDAGLDAIMVVAAPRKVFGWREDFAGLVMLDIEMDELAGAWRL